MRWLNWIIALPFMLVAISFIVSNRQNVNLNIWPLPFEITLPVSVMGALLFLAGFFIGGFIVWLSGGPMRRQARYMARKLHTQSVKNDPCQRNFVHSRVQIFMRGKAHPRSNCR